MIVPLPEQKQEMIELIREVKEIIKKLPNTKAPLERLKTVERLEAIRKEMQEYRRKYPND